MALERFIPKSPDIFIRNSQDFEVAKFGHLNTIVEYINNNSAKPAGLNGYVQFNDNSALGGDAGLFWDNVNKRLGVGTVTPATTFQVNGVQALTNADLTGYNLYSSFNIVRNGGTSIALDRFTGAPHFNFRAAGGTIASPTTQVGELGNIGWWSHSGTGFNRNVLLLARAENFVGGIAQTQRLSIGMGDSGSGTEYYYEMVNGNSYFGPSAYGSTPTARVQIKGSGQTSGTTSLLVQNSTGTTSLRVYDDRVVEVPYRIHTPFIRNEYANLVLYSGSFEVEIQSSNPTNASGSLRTTGEITTTDNQTKSIININNLVPSTSASFNTLNGFAFTSAITQTTGTIRGLFINPTLNASTDFRAIETVRGNVLLATTSGNVGIGTTTPTQKLDVNGISRFRDTLNIDNNKGLGFSYVGGTSGFSILNSSSNQFQINNSNYGYNLITIPDSASSTAAVGIGTTSPTAKLQVKGNGSTSATTSLLVQNSAGTTMLSLTDAGSLSIGNGSQGTINAGTLNLIYPNTITYNSTYNFNIGGTTAGNGTISVDGSSMRFLASNNGITFSQPNAKSFLIKKEQGGADQTSFLDISGADMTNTAYNAKGGPVRIYGGLNNGIAEQGLVVLAHNGTTTQGAVVVGGTSANVSALMDIQSTTKGFLPPRMTTAQRVAIASPVNGLIVFDTDVQNLCYRRDSVWVQATFAAV